jgi:methionyl-tRNA formyltransferase
VQVRAFAGWPGTHTNVRIVEEGRQHSTVHLKILRSRVPLGHPTTVTLKPKQPPPENCSGLTEVVVADEALLIPCGDGSMLELQEVQVAGRKACSAQAFRNGLSGKRLFIEAVQ